MLEKPWTVSAALLIVQEALRIKGLTHSSLDLIRFGTGAVYKIYPQNIVVRVTRPGYDLELLRKEEGLRSWLEENSFPVLEPLYPGEDPILVGDSYVGFWQFAPPAENPAEIKDLAQLIRQLHDLGDRASRDILYQAGVRTFNPFPAIDKFFVEVEKDRRISWADLVLLKEWRDLLEDRLRSEARDPNYSALGLGLIHGDAHLGNCYMTESGPVLIDFDFAAWGPREWDLIPAILESRRFGSGPNVYYDFSEVYGADILSWPGLETMLLIRELLITGWRLSVEKSGAVQEESKNRLLYWRRDPAPPLWRPF